MNNTEKEDWKKMKRASETCRTIAKGLTFMSLESRKEKTKGDPGEKFEEIVMQIFQI